MEIIIPKKIVTELKIKTGEKAYIQKKQTTTPLIKREEIQNQQFCKICKIHTKIYYKKTARGTIQFEKTGSFFIFLPKKVSGFEFIVSDPQKSLIIELPNEVFENE